MFTSKGLDKYFLELSEQMWTILPVDKDFAMTLLDSAKASNDFRPAGVGGDARKMSALRSDSIRWIEAVQGKTEFLVLEKLSELKQSLQLYFRMHLENLECHFSVYEPGQFYVRHRDTGSFSNDTTRIFSFVIYLNPEWQSGDGGELRGYCGESTLFEVEPCLGSMILFRSELEHEVLPARRTRYALTGWFRK